MNKKKQTPNAKLQKVSVIFMQLGLLLALFSVYVILEHESTYKVDVFSNAIVDEPNDPIIPTDFIVIPNKKIKVIKPKKIVITPITPTKPTTTFVVVDDTTPSVIDQPVLMPTDDEPETPIVTPITVANIVPEDDEPEDVTVKFVAVEISPAFPSCDKKLSKTELRMCFNEKMKKHINRKFNVELAQDLGLSPGKKRISVEFIIDKKGKIDILRVRAPHKRLEKEAIRVVKLLPIMIPARQQSKNVNVKFNLPIVFIVED